jgi:hypothetical protein
MLTPVQQRTIDRFAKTLLPLGDDALIDTYHQAWEGHRAARAEGSETSARPTRRVLRPKWRCGIAFLIIKAATGYGTREPARPPTVEAQ